MTFGAKSRVKGVRESPRMRTSMKILGKEKDGNNTHQIFTDGYFDSSNSKFSHMYSLYL